VQRRGERRGGRAMAVPAVSAPTPTPPSPRPRSGLRIGVRPRTGALL
jgi:hypothetical protein